MDKSTHTAIEQPVYVIEKNIEKNWITRKVTKVIPRDAEHYLELTQKLGETVFLSEEEAKDKLYSEVKIG